MIHISGSPSLFEGSHVALFLFPGSAETWHQSTALAETAWALARAGRRVLLVDAVSTDSGVPLRLSYLPVLKRSPNLPERLAQFLATFLCQRRVAAPQVQRVVLPGPTGDLDVLSWEGIPEESSPTANDHLPVLRPKLDELRYHHILIAHHPTERSSRILSIVDTLVLGFSDHDEAMAKAANLAEALLPYKENLNLAAVLFASSRDQERSQRIRDRFPRPRAGRWFGLVDVAAGGPNPPPLVGLANPDAAPTGYAALADALCGGGLRAPRLPPRFDRRFLRRAEGCLGAELTPEPIYVAYHPANRLWGDWIAAQLGRFQISVELVADSVPQPPENDSVIIVVGTSDFSHEVLSDWLSPARSSALATGHEVVCVRVSPLDPVAPSGTHQIDLCTDASLREEEASARLLAPFLLTTGPGGSDRLTGLHFPLKTSPRPFISLPAPSDQFVGRDQELERLRAGLLKTHPQVITGPPGSGKTELAIAYATRFGQDYELVWLVPATNRQSIHDSLTSLRERPHPNRGRARGLDSYRQLIILDALDDLDTLDQEFPGRFLPPAQTQHIIITSRCGGPRALEQMTSIFKKNCREIAVGAMSSRGAVRILAHGLPGLTADQASHLVQRLDSSPLTLSLIAAGLAHHANVLAHRGYVRDEKIHETLNRYHAALPTPPDACAGPADASAAPETVAPGAEAALGAVLSALEGSVDPLHHIALCLARMCVFLSPDGISLVLLRDTAMIDVLVDLVNATFPSQDLPEGTRFARDLAQFDAMLWAGDRSGLFTIDWGRTTSLRMNRTVANVLRTSMEPGLRHQVQSRVLTGLARYAPNEAELQVVQHHAKLRALHRHLAPSGALESTDWTARQWVVQQLEDVQRYGDQMDWRLALDLVNEVHQRWDEHESTRDDLLARLEQIQARLLFHLGKAAEAIEAQRALQMEFGRSLGTNHYRTLLAIDQAAWMSSYSGDYREASRQSELLGCRIREAFGGEHPSALRMAQNTASIIMLNGDFRGAQALGRETLAMTQAQAGRGDRRVWRMMTTLGFLNLYRGDYTQAGELFDKAIISTSANTAADRMILRVAKRGRAAVNRALGRSTLIDDQHLLEEHRSEKEPDPLELSACLMAVACDHYAFFLQGNDRAEALQAVALATEARDIQEREQGPQHPLRYLCELNLAVFQYASGNAAEARHTALQARRGLDARSEAQHPWTLAAAANHLCLVAMTDPTDGRRQVAEELGGIARALNATLGDHPFTQTVERNLARVDPFASVKSPSRRPTTITFITIDMP